VPRYTESRIQQLCKEAVEAKTPAELERVIPDLRAALEEHTRLAKESLKLQRKNIDARDAASKPKNDPSEEGC
jgi:hypothetical protein